MEPSVKGVGLLLLRSINSTLSLQLLWKGRMKKKSLEAMLYRLVGLTPDEVTYLIATIHHIASQEAAVGAIDRKAREPACPHRGSEVKQW